MAVKREKRLRGLRDYLRIIVHQREAPDAIALGVCIGLFAGLSPLYGLQIATAFFLALLLRGSKIAAVLLVWVTNPFTMIPVYSFTYWVGSKILSSPVREKSFREFIRYCIRHLRVENADEARTVIAEALRLGRDILPPLCIGGLAVAAVSSLLVYPLVKQIVSRFRTARSLRLGSNRRRRIESEGGVSAAGGSARVESTGAFAGSSGAGNESAGCCDRIADDRERVFPQSDRSIRSRITPSHSG